jgi:hypothetical protein
MSNKVVLLPLVEDDDVYALEKSNSATFTLNTIPTAVAGAGSTYKYQAWILTGNESVRVLLKWSDDVARVLMGLNAMTVARGLPVIYSLMRGTPRVAFDTSVRIEGTKRRLEAAEAARTASDAAGGTAAEQQAAFDAVMAEAEALHLVDNDMKVCINYVLKELMPRQVLAKVKRYLRRDCRKPFDMKVRTYYQQFIRVNSEELPGLLIDIFLHGTPKSWQNEMDRQGFDPTEHTLLEVVDFMERIESTEDFSGTKVEGKKKSSSDKKEGKMSAADGSKKQFCLIHGYGSHSSDNCHHLKEEAKRFKTDRSKTGGSSTKKTYTTWVKKAAESTSGSKKELAAFIKKQVDSGVQKQLASLEKKRKSSKDMNVVDVDVDEFNYSDIENLKIDSDDDVSV